MLGRNGCRRFSVDRRSRADIGRNVVVEGKTTKRRQAARTRAVPLPAHIDIANVGELKQLLTNALAAETPLVLDASAVEQVDAAGMQLLLAFCRNAQTHGRSTGWKTISPRLHDAARLLGMADALGLSA
jgi:anti-anti-sigma factor